MKSYKETKAAVKSLILKKRGIYNIYNLDLSILYEQGHNVTNVQNALDYFKYSPQAKSFMDTNGGKRTTARLLDSKKGVFLMEGDKIGNVQMGPTYENNMEPGIFARTFTMERPLREVVEVVAAGFPKIMYPELIKICTVR